MHYLETEFRRLLQTDSGIVDFLEAGSTDGLWYWDLTRPDEEWMSPGFKALFGYAEDEIPNTSAWWQEHIHPEDRAVALENFERHAADPAHPYDQIVRYRHRDGSTVWVRCRGLIIRGDDGEPRRMLGVHTDVTKLKASELALASAHQRLQQQLDDRAAALEVSEASYRAVFNAAPVGIAKLGLDGSLVDVNPTLCAIVGYSRDELLAGSFKDITDPADVDEDLAQLKALADGIGTSVHREKRCVRRDGTRIWVNRSLSIVRDSGGAPRYFISTVQDIHQRKMAERLNRRLTRRLERAESIARIGYWLYRVADSHLEWSDELWRIYGREKRAIDFAESVEWIHPDRRRDYRAQCDRAFRGGGNVDPFISCLERPDGEIRWIETSFDHESDRNDAVETVFAVVKDITHDRFLDHRTKLLNARLQRSNAELEKFAYVVSHDLKSPLRGLDSLARWIREDLGDRLVGESERHLSLMEARVGRMSALLDGLLEYGRVGRKSTPKGTTDLETLVADALAVDPPAEGFDVVLATNPDLHLEVSPVATIVRNLVGNAVKHHDRESGRIEIDVEENGHEYAFVVRDDGPGIAVQYHERIFQIFQTLRPRDEVEGCGLGLALVKKTVETRGGVVSIESDPSAGRGTVIRFTWPKSDESLPIVVEVDR